MQLPHSKPGGSGDKDGPNNLVTGNDFQSGASAASTEPDFSEYMWMANEDLDDFDRKVISEIDEHFGLDICTTTTIGEEEEEFLQKMLEEEEERDTVYFLPQDRRVNNTVSDLANRMLGMNVSGEGIAAQSILNPLAAEFVPGQGFQDASVVATTALHSSVIAQPSENPLYCNSLQGGVPSSIQTGPPSQNLFLGSKSSQQLLGQQHHQQLQLRQQLQQQQQQQLRQHQEQQQQLQRQQQQQQQLQQQQLQQQQLRQEQQQQQLHQQRFANPVRGQLNGHNQVASVASGAAVTRFYGVNVPPTVYVSNMAGVYPLMNGSQYIQATASAHSHLQQQPQQQNHFPNVETVGKRGNNDDEGYGDN